MNSIRGPQYPIFLEELLFDRKITLESSLLRLPTYYLSLSTYVFSPRVTFFGRIVNILEVDIQEETPIFLRPQSQEDVIEEEYNTSWNRTVNISTHILHLEGLSQTNTITVLISNIAKNFDIGQILLVSAKCFDPSNSREFLDIFLRVEQARVLTPSEYKIEAAISLNSLNSRINLLNRIHAEDFDPMNYPFRHLLNMFDFSEKYITMMSYEQMCIFREGLINHLRQL